jgi:hypothetical protein
MILEKPSGHRIFFKPQEEEEEEEEGVFCVLVFILFYFLVWGGWQQVKVSWVQVKFKSNQMSSSPIQLRAVLVVWAVMTADGWMIADVGNKRTG